MPAPIESTETPIDISVIIPAYGGRRTIARCLESVERAIQGRSAEVIVVESSGDGAADIIRERFPRVKLIQSKERLSAGAARNRGVEIARGRLIFLTDQDCVVPPDWIDRLGRYLEDRTVGAAGGSVGIQDPGNLSGCAVYFLEFLYHFPGSGRPERNGNFMVGCNSAYSSSALKSVRFPDQTLGEDILFSHQLSSRGYSLIYDPGVEVRHHNRSGWGEFFNYNRKMGRSAAVYHNTLQLRWIAPFFRLPGLIYVAPLVVLPSIGLDLVRSRLSYFLRFLMLSPMCFLGNLVWAHSFRKQVIEIRATQLEDSSRRA